MEKYTLSQMNDKNFAKAVSEIYQTTAYNNRQYPGYPKWFWSKNIPRIFSKTGEIIFYIDGFTVAGLAILKKDIEQSKLCTFHVNEEYRRKGTGSLILEDSFKY